MKKIIIGIIIICALLAIVLIIIKPSSKPIKVGFVAGLSGRLSELGISARNGAQLAINAINNEGGINGRMIQFIPKDNKGDPETTYTVINELINEGVNIIIGPFLSSMAEPTLRAVKDKDVLVISPTISTDAVKDIDDNFIRLALVSSSQAHPITKDIVKKGYHSIAVVYDISNKAYTDPIYKLLKEIVSKEQKKIVYVNSLEDKDNIDFITIAREIKTSQAEALVLITSGIDAAALCQQIYKTGYNIDIYGTSWVKANYFLQHGGKAVEGVKLVNIYENPVKTPEYMNFKNLYHDTYKVDPSFISIQGYDAIRIMALGIDYYKSSKPALMKKAILTIQTFQGLDEVFTINKFGDADRKLSVFVVKNGEYVRVDE